MLLPKIPKYRIMALLKILCVLVRDVLVEIDLGAGDASATLWTNDLTYDYVKENAEYSS